jgi:hypothetical protein
MKYLPFENITYRSILDQQEVLKRIEEIIEPPKTLSLSDIFGNNDHRPYKGSTTGNSFSMTRIINYKNSFLPRIIGVIEEDHSGTRINVKMRLHKIVFAFMLLWLGVAGIVCLGVFATMFGDQDFAPQSLIPFAMFLFGYALVTGGFKYESIKSRKYLAELFEAEMDESTRYQKV